MARGTQRLLAAEVCQLYRLDPDGTGLQLLGLVPGRRYGPDDAVRRGLLLAALDGRGDRPAARRCGPSSRSPTCW